MLQDYKNPVFEELNLPDDGLTEEEEAVGYIELRPDTTGTVKRPKRRRGSWVTEETTQQVNIFNPLFDKP